MIQTQNESGRMKGWKRRAMAILSAFSSNGRALYRSFPKCFNKLIWQAKDVWRPQLWREALKVRRSPTTTVSTTCTLICFGFTFVARKFSARQTDNVHVHNCTALTPPNCTYSHTSDSSSYWPTPGSQAQQQHTGRLQPVVALCGCSHSKVGHQHQKF